MDDQATQDMSGDYELEQSLLFIIKDAEGKLANRDLRIKRHRALYEMQHYAPDATAGLTISQKRLINNYSYTSAAPTNTINMVTGMMAHNALRFSAFTYDENKDTLPLAGQMERFCSALVQTNSIEQEVDIHHDVIHNCALDGGVALRCVWVPEEDAEEVPAQENLLSPLDKIANTARRVVGKPEIVPQSKNAYMTCNPLKIHVIPLMNMVYAPGGPKGRWFLVAYRARRTIADMRTEFPDFRSDITNLQQTITTTVEFYDVWFWNNDCVCNAIFADSKMLRCCPMPDYDDLPYTIVFFYPNDTSDPSYWGLSMLFNIEDDVRMLEDRVAHQSRMLDIWANLPLVVKTRDGRPVDVDAVFGSVINLLADESIGFAQPGSEPPDHDKLVAWLKNSISESTFPPMMYGDGGGSGYGLAQLGEGGRIRLEQPKRQIELLWIVTMRKALSLFRKFAPEKGIEVYGEYKGKRYTMNQLTGSATSGWMMDVILDPHFPQDEARMMALGNQALAMKGLSRRTVQEKYYGVDDPDRENNRILVEMLQQSPAMMDTILQQVAHEYGMEMPQTPGPQGSPPRQPISQPMMSNPEQGVQPLPLAGSPQVEGNQQRMASAIGGMPQ